MRAHASDASPSRILWIDTDAGVDDAQALILAAHAKDTHIVGVSTVFGNTVRANPMPLALVHTFPWPPQDLNNVNRNVLRVLTACGLADSVPVYQGASEPLVSGPVRLSEPPWHGYDGLGDAPQVWPTAADVQARLSPGLGALKLLECAAQHPGSLHVIMLGPLTNLALAVKLDPSLPERIGQLVVMGGAKGPGNMTPHAEFNFWCDPEAAAVVMSKFPRVVLADRDVGLAHPLPWADWERMLAKDTRIARFLAEISKDSIVKSRDHPDGYITHDPTAVLVAIAPEAILSSEHVRCVVELQGTYTRGMSVLDWERRLGKEPNVELVTRLDLPLLLRLMEGALETL